MLLQDDGPEPFLHTYVPPSERSLSRSNSVLPNVTYNQEDMAKPVQTSSGGTQLSEPGTCVCAYLGYQEKSNDFSIDSPKRLYN